MSAAHRWPAERSSHPANTTLLQDLSRGHCYKLRVKNHKELLLGVVFHGPVVRVGPCCFGALAGCITDACVFRRDRLHEPLVPQFGDFTGLHHFFDGVFTELFESWVILVDHDGDGLDAQHFAHDFEVRWGFGSCNIARQNGTVHHKGFSAARPQQQEAVRVVLAKYFLEINASCTFVFTQRLNRRCTGGGGNRFAIELGNGIDTRAGFDGNTDFFDECCRQESDVFLACGVVGGRATFNINGAVLNQWNAVLRCDHLVFDFKLSACRFFKVGNDLVANFNVVAGVLAISQGVGQCARRLAHTHGDNASVLGFGEDISRLRKNAAGGKQGQGKGRQFEFHEVSCQ